MTSKTVSVSLNDKVVAQSNQTKIIEGNHYFPPDSIVKEHFTDSETTTHCHWKGDASYYNVVGLKDSAWYYPNPLDKAKEIKNYVAFYKNKFKIEEI